VAEAPGATLPLLLFSLDTSGRVLCFGRGAEEVSGYPSSQMVGTDPLSRLFPVDADRIRTALSSDESGEIDVEATLRTIDGRQRHVRIAGTAGGDGVLASPTTCFIVALDEVAPLDCARSFVAPSAEVLAVGLAHEIRNPLNGAGLHLSVLERELTRTDGAALNAARAAAAVVRSELGRMASFVADFLDVVQDGALVRAQTDLRGVVRSAVDAAQADADARGVELRCTLPDAPVAATVDCERVERVVGHLLTNAFEAIGRGGRVVVRLSEAGTEAIVEVEDDGPGVPDAVPSPFEPFQTNKRTGTGLGLSVVRRVVRSHGGEVTYRSSPGCTIFRVQLPLEVSPRLDVEGS
jgi:signal transduction histidine kinase